MKSPTQSRTPKGRKLPKGRVMYAESNVIEYIDTWILQSTKYGPDLEVPVAVIPCRTKREAAQVVKLHADGKPLEDAAIVAYIARQALTLQGVDEIRSILLNADSEDELRASFAYYIKQEATHD